MLSPMPYAKTCSEEAVLDLCVRKCVSPSVRKCVSPRAFRPPSEIRQSPPVDIYYPRGEDRGPYDNGYSATVTVMNNRLYEDKLTSSYGSEGDSSQGPLSPDPGNRFSGPTSSPLSPISSNSYNGLPTSVAQITPASTTRPGKPTRPFKAYPKDPLTFVGPAADYLNTDSNEAYAEFRRRMLEQVQAATGNNSGNKNMKRPVESLSPPNQQPSSSMDSKNSAYWERRRKNNESAKRSRDARRAKEDEIAIRAAFLEQENVKLKYEVAALRNETNRLRCMLYSN